MESIQCIIITGAYGGDGDEDEDDAANSSTTSTCTLLSVYDPHAESYRQEIIKSYFITITLLLRPASHFCKMQMSEMHPKQTDLGSFSNSGTLILPARPGLIRPTDSHRPITPPSTTIFSPVTKSLARLAKKMATPMRSSGSPQRRDDVLSTT